MDEYVYMCSYRAAWKNSLTEWLRLTLYKINIFNKKIPPPPPPGFQIFQSICATPNFKSWIRPWIVFRNPLICLVLSGYSPHMIILYVRTANDSRRYTVMSSIIGWALVLNEPYLCFDLYESSDDSSVSPEVHRNFLIPRVFHKVQLTFTNLLKTTWNPHGQWKSIERQWK